MNILISACLIGTPCRYDGASKPLPEATLATLRKNYTLIPVCPESDGGLPTPRIPAEIVGDKILRRDGVDVTAAYEKGAAHALEVALQNDCRYAVLKERSPSCSKGNVYDGTFSGTLRRGNGITADLLMQSGITVLGESEISLLPDFPSEYTHKQ